MDRGPGRVCVKRDDRDRDIRRRQGMGSTRVGLRVSLRFTGLVTCVIYMKKKRGRRRRKKKGEKMH